MVASSCKRDSDSAYHGRLEMTLADKYGYDSGEQAGIGVGLVQSNIDYNGLTEEVSVYNIPPVGDWASADFVSLRGLRDGSVDLVQTGFGLPANLLHVAFDDSEAYIRRSRFVHMYVPYPSSLSLSLST
jgi:hypothetical protein